MRPIRVAALSAAAALVLAAAPVLAAKGTHEQVRVDETFDEVLCGIPVTTNVRVTGPVNTTSGGRLTDNTRVVLTHTNAAGEWLRNMITGQFRQVVIENADGTVTFIDTHRGLHERLVSAGGIEAAFDRGQIIFRTTVDFHDPEDPEDDEVVDFEVTKQAGPHPDADSDFELFCEVVDDVLG